MPNKKEPSQFNQRADNAAMALKGDISRRFGKDLPSTQVAVGPDGKPPAPLPPEGSYARESIEQQSAQAQIGDQPPVGTQEQMLDGSVAPPMTPAPEQQEPQGEPDISQNAQNRISDLSAQLRTQGQELQQALSDAQTAGAGRTELEEKVTQLQRDHETLLQSNLDNLDPETRMQVMQDARMREYLTGFKKDMIDEIMPHIQGLQKQSANQEMMALGDVFPSFDIQIHGTLIEMYRGKNPASTIEQAFKAIATPDELVTRQTAAGYPVPPIVQPGQAITQARYMPEPKSDPEAELREEARQLHELARSDDPSTRRELGRRQHQHLMARLGNVLPGS